MKGAVDIDIPVINKLDFNFLKSQILEIQPGIDGETLNAILEVVEKKEYRLLK